MSKTLDIDGFDVIIRVPVREETSFNGGDKQTPEQAERAAEAIHAAVRRHLLHDFGRYMGGTYVRRDAKFVCENCQSPWTEKSDTYNGGCCISDEEDEEQRIRDNGALGVGA